MPLRHLAGMPAGRRALSVGASFQARPVIHHVERRDDVEARPVSHRVGRREDVVVVALHRRRAGTGTRRGPRRRGPLGGAPDRDRRALFVARRAAGGTRRRVSGRHQGARSLRDGSGGLIDVFLSRRKRVSVMHIF